MINVRSLSAFACAVLVAGCATMRVTELAEVEPQPAREISVVRETGTLRVNSGYSLYASDGRLLRRSADPPGRAGEESQEMNLAPGEYYVVGEAARGVVRVPVTIAADRTTVVDLQRRR